MTPETNGTPIISISKEQLSQLPAEQFQGEIRLVENETDIANAISTLRQETVIGFDTETRPSFKKGMTNSVSLIQLSTHSVCYLFRINHVGLAQPIIDLLEDPGVTKVGLSIHDDFHNLNKIAKIEPQGFVELQNFVKQQLIADNSLTRIYAIIFGKRISKGQRLTNWEAEHLTPSQQTYAALDALACIRIYDFISQGHFAPMQSPYLSYPVEEKTDPEQ